jgi:hypothetical protein
MIPAQQSLLRTQSRMNWPGEPVHLARLASPARCVLPSQAA